jgi:phage terminase Nu1 subunit (DNA packaging protein)
MKKKTKSEPKFITGSELARRLGVSEAAVRKAVSVGRIVPQSVDDKGRRLFVEKTATAMWNRNTLPEKRTGKPAVAAPPDADQPDPPPRRKINVTEARAEREAAQTRILSIKARRMEQEVVSAEEVARLWERHVGDAKRMFLALPFELKMHIPSLTADDVSLIENRICAVLETLSVWKPEDMATG